VPGVPDRGGVRLGTGELYGVVEELPEVADSLVVHLEDDEAGPGELLLFVVLVDGLVLDDGSIVAVRGIAEELTEIAASSAFDLVRFAWHIGNRHTALQVTDQKLRIRRDHVLEAMLRQIGAVLTPVDAPFDPEAGARSGHGADHHGG